MRRLIVLIVLLFASSAAACTAPPTATPTPAVRVLGDQVQQDMLTPPETARAWQFSGARGEPIHLKLDAKAGAQLTLNLQDAAGNSLAEGSDLLVYLPADGTYYAFVRAANANRRDLQPRPRHRRASRLADADSDLHAHLYAIADSDVYANRDLHGNLHAFSDFHANADLRAVRDADRADQPRHER